MVPCEVPVLCSRTIVSAATRALHATDVDVRTLDLFQRVIAQVQCQADSRQPKLSCKHSKHNADSGHSLQLAQKLIRTHVPYWPLKSPSQWLHGCEVFRAQWHTHTHIQCHAHMRIQYIHVTHISLLQSNGMQTSLCTCLLSGTLAYCS